MAAVTKALADEGPELMAELRDVFEKSSDGEDFVNRVMIGDCPKCGSSETGDCEHDPEIDDVCVARCFTCGQLWCPDCGVFFVGSQCAEHDCPAWEDLDIDDDGLELTAFPRQTGLHLSDCPTGSLAKVHSAPRMRVTRRGGRLTEDTSAT